MKKIKRKKYPLEVCLYGRRLYIETWDDLSKEDTQAEIDQATKFIKQAFINAEALRVIKEQLSPTPYEETDEEG